MHPSCGCAGRFRAPAEFSVCAACLPVQFQFCIRPIEHTIRVCVLGSGAGGFLMYAVIRTGGKQIASAPGDVLKIESVPSG